MTVTAMTTTGVDWQEIARNLMGILDRCVTQIEQMKSMRRLDDDHAIEQTLQDAEEVSASFMQAWTNTGAQTIDGNLIQSITKKIRSECDENALLDVIQQDFSVDASKANLEARVRFLILVDYSEEDILKKAGVGSSNRLPSCCA